MFLCVSSQKYILSKIMHMYINCVEIKTRKMENNINLIKNTQIKAKSQVCKWHKISFLKVEIDVKFFNDEKVEEALCAQLACHSCHFFMKQR